MKKRLDASDIQQAGLFLERQLLQTLPKVYQKKYATLWAEEGKYLPVSGAIDGYVEEIEAEILEAAGKALEYSSLGMDISVISSAVTTDKFTVHTFTIATLHSMRELDALSKAGKPIKSFELTQVNRALRQSIHELLLFGSVPRNRKGLLNNANVPLNNGSYDANTATWQQSVDFICDTLSTIADTNALTESTAYIVMSNKLRTKYGKTYESSGAGRSVLEAIMGNFGVNYGGSLKGIVAVNEVRAEYLERFGVKPVGTNEERILFLPENPDAVDRLAGTMDFLQPQAVDLSYRTVHFATTSEAMVHSPQSLRYEDIPKVL